MKLFFENMNRSLLILLVFFVFGSTMIANQEESYFSTLAKSADLQEGEKLLVAYFKTGSCIKCYYMTSDILHCVAKECDSSKYKIIGLVNCSRKKELDFYRKKYNWKFNLELGGQHSKKRLGLSNNIEIVVFNYYGDILVDFSYEEIEIGNDCCQKIIETIKR
jgi:hypothetical protein